MSEHSIEFNDSSCDECGVYVFGGYAIPAPERDITEYEIPGKDGVLTQDNGRYKPISIPVTMLFISDDEKTWNEDYTKVKRWLSAQNAELVLSDDSDYFYSCYYANIKTTKREALRFGKLSVEFYCSPYRYLKTGTSEYSASAVEYNPYDECRPIYMISGTGDCTLTVNDSELTVTVSDDVTIDTERMVAYTSDGIANTSVSGDYDSLYLAAGDNTITITDGFTLTVIPNWREV